MRKMLIVAAATLLATGAWAGTLTNVQTESTLQGVTTIVTQAQSNGASTSNSATWGGGNAFAATSTITGLAAPVSKLTVALNNHSPLSVTGGGAVSGGVQTGQACVFIFGACAIPIPVNSGAAGTQMLSNYGIIITLINQDWTIGVASATGLTSSGVALPNVTTTGSFNLTAGGGGTITLVTANTTRVDASAIGATLSTTAGAGYLRLTFAGVPEPGTLLLLGAGALGLAAVGRRRS